MGKLGNLGSFGVVHGHPKNYQAVLAVLLLQLLKPWHLDFAGRTPRRPEIQQHGFAPEVGELHSSSIQRRQVEIGRLHPFDIPYHLERPMLTGTVQVLAGSQHPKDGCYQNDEYQGIPFHEGHLYNANRLRNERWPESNFRLFKKISTPTAIRSTPLMT